MKVSATSYTKPAVHVVLDRVRLRMVLRHVHFPGSDGIELRRTFWACIHFGGRCKTVAFLRERNVHDAQSVVVLTFPGFMFDMLLLVISRRLP